MSFDHKKLKTYSLLGNKRHPFGIYMTFDSKNNILMSVDKKRTPYSFYQVTKLLKSARYPKRGCICADGSVINNGKPGMMGSFKVIDTSTFNNLFVSSQIKNASNNISELMGLMKAIDIADGTHKPQDIYCDSIIALNWLYQGFHTSEFGDTKLFKAVDRGYTYLKTREPINHRIWWWRTKEFGENPSDLGGKTNLAYMMDQFDWLDSKHDDIIHTTKTNIRNLVEERKQSKARLMSGTLFLEFL